MIARAWHSASFFLRRYGLRPHWTALIASSLVLLSVLLWGLTGCRGKTASSLIPGRPGSSHLALSQIRDEPIVRVRIKRGITRTRIDSDGKIRIRTQSDQKSIRVKPPLLIEHLASQGILRITTATDPVISRDWRSFLLEPTGHRLLHADGVPYPGTIAVHLRLGTKTFDLVNHVKMEQYLPGVLHRELYRHWPAQTFVAQAIAARSYALTEMARRRRHYFDLESTQASQAYAGKTAHSRAVEAVTRTRGHVLAYDGQVVPAFYSSCSGGTGQDAAFAFPNAVDIPPLRGRYHGGWCSASKYYRWGPIRRDRTTLGRRITSWGQRRGHAVAGLRHITTIRIDRRNAVGRPASFLITDSNGKKSALGPEDFRRACNYADSSLPRLSADARLRSSHVTVRVTGEQVHVTDGRGFGHGVGMCQHGAQAMALKGYDARAILAFYYRDAELVDVY